MKRRQTLRILAPVAADTVVAAPRTGRDRETIGRVSLALVAILAFSASAVAQTWSGAGTTWNTASNWSPAVVPNSTTAAVNFTGNGVFYAATITSNVSAQSLSFSNPTLGYSVTSSAGVTLSGVSAINVAPGVSTLQVIALANIATGSLLAPPSGNLTITNNSTAAGTTLLIGATTVIGMPGTSGGDTIFNGAGTTQVSGSWVGAPGDNRPGSIEKYGPGTLILSNPTNNYQATSIYAGTVLLGAGTAIPSYSTVVVWGGELNISNLSNTAATKVGTLEVFDDGVFRVPSGNGDYHIGYLFMGGGTLNFAGSSNFWLHVGNVVGGIRTYSNSTSASWIGSGTSRIQNDNSAPLTIDVDAGSTPSGIDLDAGIILSNGGTNATFIKDGAGTMRLTNPGNTANINVVEGNLRVDDMTHLGSGIITLNGGTLQYSGASATTTKGITTAGTGAIWVSTPGANLNYNGTINQSSFANLNVLGPGAGSAPSTLTLANNNNYAGGTTVYNNAILAIPTIANFSQPSPVGSDPFNLGISLGASDARGTLLLTGSPAGYTTNRNVAISGLFSSGGGGAFGVQNADTNLTLSGQITGSGSLIKTGPGTLFLSNTTNNYAGGTYVDVGRLHVNNDAALGTAGVTINPSGILRYTASATVGRNILLVGGALEAPSGINLAAAGALQGQGTVVGNVANSGFVGAVGSPGLLHVEGNYTQSSSGTLVAFADLFLLPANNPRLVVTGDVALGGALQLNLGGMGQFRGTRSIDVLDWTGNLSGIFSTLQLPMFGGAFTWDTSQLYVSGILTLTGPPLEGDFNHDGTVDAADYVVWRKGLGSVYNQVDYQIWRTHFGQSSGVGSGDAVGSPSKAAVPEPTTLVLLMFATAGWCLRRRPAV